MAVMNQAPGRPAASMTADQPSRSHQPRDSLAADMDAMVQAELGVDPWGAVGGAAALMDGRIWAVRAWSAMVWADGGRDLQAEQPTRDTPARGTAVGLTRFDGHPTSGVLPLGGCPSWRPWNASSLACVGRSRLSSRPRSWSCASAVTARSGRSPATST